MNFSDEAQAAFLDASMVLSEPEPILYNGAEKMGIVRETVSAAHLRLSGIESVDELVIAFVKSQFTQAPDDAARPKISVRGRTWVVVATQTTAAHYLITVRPVT